jgi:hypothetical protein
MIKCWIFLFFLIQILLLISQTIFHEESYMFSTGVINGHDCDLTERVNDPPLRDCQRVSHNLWPSCRHSFMGHTHSNSHGIVSPLTRHLSPSQYEWEMREKTAISNFDFQDHQLSVQNVFYLLIYYTPLTLTLSFYM